ncbi:hypothetical protein ScPMuIL_018336 [Solemya velum]
MSISNVGVVAEEFKKIAGKEADVGAQYFMKAFALPGVQDVFPTFKDKTVTEDQLKGHGELVLKFMIGRLAGNESEAAVTEFVTSHKKKPGLSTKLIASTKDILVDTLAANGLDKGIVGTFVNEFVEAMGDW